MAKPPIDISLDWDDDFRFRARSGELRFGVDGQGRTAPSPVALLLVSLAACTGADVVDILRKGRQTVRGLSVEARGERRQEPPHRFTRIRLTFLLEGEVDRGKAERAVELSFETYCSVLHSLADDLEVGWELELA